MISNWHRWTRRRSVRAALALLFALVFTAQSQAMASHALAMSMGIEICTAEGMVLVDHDGKPLPKESMQHDCCGIGTLGAASAPPCLDALELQHAAPSAPMPASALAAEWLGPLSRGPPIPS
ncbi:hypothetical protein BH09PSE6_BH09PSE6_01080 [soil metagenome]